MNKSIIEPMTTYKYISIAIAISMSLFSSVFANNVEVENISITGQNNASDTKFIELDVSWENSWRTSAAPSNWDAIWLFAKYRLTSGTLWEHATLSSINGDHVAPTGSQVSAVSDGKGIFLYRDADGFGNNDFDNLQMLWDYGIDGLADNDSVEICVYAVEMVYVPQGDFTLGDGNGTTHSTNAFEIGTTNNYVTISTAIINDVQTTNTDAVPLTSPGIGIDGDGGLDINNDGDVTDPGDNPNFPTGYNSFYTMKYEISQGQYVDFLNKLTIGQGTLRMTALTTSRHNMTGTGNNWTTLTPNRACGRLNWMDLSAYADWTGLRPMTELEYEKSCRGQITSVLNEFAWGSTSIYAALYTLSMDGTGSEAITNMGTSTGNANYSTTDPSGPVRSGIFASSSANNTREETGGSYYGIMELSGNVNEMVVTLGDANGLAYDGSHGDGELALTGNANQLLWPGNSGTEITTADASGVRGGAWNSSPLYLQVSNRTYANTEVISRSTVYGGRCVRTAP
ncbi:MAG: SUMF1/EgtB/PvdO family nonheme iron enzyme [Crocinitomicaceae bacterium]|nr:SUMF1/EgtB/PvdO family nonheme iron enzyme [Flavobacteriales bacterium]NQZ35402.1 SUMF1/EgtB/PvdO family nonheme iron enzyme [Crocinitomicaceae bacterium]